MYRQQRNAKLDNRVQNLTTEYKISQQNLKFENNRFQNLTVEYHTKYKITHNIKLHNRIQKYITEYKKYTT